MRVFLKQFLLLSSVVVFLSCTPLKGYRRTKAETNTSTLRSSVIDSTVLKSVYKAKINVYNNYFSGLFLIKYIPVDSSYRVVFLSEVGLNLLDFRYQNNEFTVVSCQEFLNKKMLLRTLQNDFQLLFLKIDAVRKLKNYEKRNYSSQAIVFRHKWDKIYYFWQGKNEYFRIFKKDFFYGSVDVLIHYGQQYQIDEMNFKHKGIKLEMNLLRLNKGE